MACEKQACKDLKKACKDLKKEYINMSGKIAENEGTRNKLKEYIIIEGDKRKAGL